MKNRTIKLLALLLCFAFSCKQKDLALLPPPVITKMLFTKADNPTLLNDVEATINGDVITIEIFGATKAVLKPRITTNATITNYNGEAIDFTQPKVISLVSADGEKVDYRVTAVFRTVYLAGAEMHLSRSLATYWKNGNKITLTPPGNLDVSEISLAIVVKDNDIYIAGSSMSLITGHSTAVYWKNGVKVELPSIDEANHHIAQALAIKVIGDDVFVMGRIYYPGTTPEGAGVDLPVYWKNGVLTRLNADHAHTQLASLFIHQNDVYITGYTQGLTNENYKAAYWKNGVEVVLTDGTKTAVAQDLKIINNEVNIVGVEGGYAVHWKNGVKKVLDRGMAYSIETKGNDVYIGGCNSNLDAVSWKNGIPFKTSVGIKGIGLLNIANEIYLLGYEIDHGTIKFLASTGNKPQYIGALGYIPVVENPHSIYISTQ